MAKKSKRPVRRLAAPVTEKSTAEQVIISRPTGFNPDYHFVVKDIRRVGILAGSFIVILVVLSFFLH